jgi:hypothetical protein
MEYMQNGRSKRTGHFDFRASAQSVVDPVAGNQERQLIGALVYGCGLF